MTYEETLVLVAIISASIFTLTTLKVVTKVTFEVIRNEPKFLLKAICSAVIGTLIGMLKNGYVSYNIDLAIFGLFGLLIYIWYLVLSTN